MNERPADIAEALAEAARDINKPQTLDETLEAIVRAAQRSVPGFDHVGISITHRDGKIETLAATDPIVLRLDELQYELGEGPCLDAIREAPVVIVEHAEHDQRWPRYMPRAAPIGLRAQLALQLYNDEGSIGGLNLYSTRSPTVEPDAVRVAELFASHAAIALGRARREEQLNDALVTRKVIGQAIGLTMEHYQIPEDRAFLFLVRASQTSNVKLRDVAQNVVDMANERFAPRD